MFRSISVSALVMCLSLALAPNALAQKQIKGAANDEGGVAGAGIPELSTTRVASALWMPLFVTAPPGETNRLFILEQRMGTVGTGRIRILDLTTNPPTLLPTPYLTISGLSTGDEQGLLGLAFHPDFANNGYFWVYYTTSTDNVVRYQANAPYATSNTAFAGSATPLLNIADPESNHNGGWIGFAPNDTQGYLYISIGDGGGANDQHGTFGNGQNLNVLLGKLLRIDIDGADNIPGNDDDDGVIGSTLAPYTNPASNPFFGPTTGMDQIWAYGLRNPWRPSFDRLTADLYIGDVGQSAREEVDFQPANDEAAMPGDPTYMGGRNYGWRCMEGNLCTGMTGCTCNDSALTLPIYDYTHSSGCSITGGYVYRGPAIPELQGTYFFADYCQAQIWTFKYAGVSPPPITTRTSELAPGDGQAINSITSFGEDAVGEIYITDRGSTASPTGEVFKIVPEPPNNLCANATPVNEGSYPFSTIGATTDGFVDTVNCNFGGYTNVGRDIWYDYTAGCTGTVTVSLCGANYNSRLAVYSGAICPISGQQAIACNDDSCGTASQLTFDATQASHYRIRVGGMMVSGNIQTGSGTMVITCTPPTPTGACCMSNGTCSQLSQADCKAASGAYQGDGLLCGDVACTQPCTPDVNGDLVVNSGDLLAIINSWGPCGVPCPTDLNGDNVVNTADLLLVINAWGPCP